MKNIILFGCFLACFGFSIIEKEIVKKVLSDSLTLQGEIDSDEPEWVFALKCYYKDTIIFQADPNDEFELNDRWTKFKEIDKSQSQIFITKNDRPFNRKILLLNIKNNKLTTQQLIPYLNNLPKDYDNDGVLEYAGVFDESEEVNAKVGYTPILYFEDKNGEFVLDSSATQSINQKLWGKFYGFEQDERILLPKPGNWEKYAN